MKRSAGILLHISSLPSPYGIGTLGRQAYAFVERLAAANQRYWQVLPLGPTGYGDSPYQSFSAFAGNPYFIDLETLVDDGLLDAAAVGSIDWGNEPGRVSFERVYAARFGVLREAFARAGQNDEMQAKIADFSRDNAGWLEDYALFMALKDAFGGAPWTDWPDALRLREEAALAAARERLANDAAFHRFTQYLFFTQWANLRAYAREHGVSLIGDLPIYVPFDSADVWSAPEEFQLDEDRRPLFVAGVPPDYFTADGQLWGNPIYDWAHMRQTGYAWWLRRMGAAAALFDCVRIDHFRGLASYWRVAAYAETAREGEWVEGPGLDFVETIKGAFPALEIIAEDLGYLTDDVRALLHASGFRGMKVLQFAFDAREPSDYLPHTYERRCVCYAGTHDNTTARAWFAEADPADAAMAVRYLGLSEEEGYVWGMLRGGMGSVADLFVAQMQDYLNLGAFARMNTPGSLGGGNWRWRLQIGEFGDALAERIGMMTRLYGRA